jgi:hypothetical protein
LQAGTREFGVDVFDGCNSLNEVRIVDLSGWCQSEFATPLANPAYLSKKLNYMGDVVADLVIPTTAVNIGKNAFYGYTPLKSVTFHDNVSSVSTDAFANCDNLAEVNISDLASWCNIDFMSETSNPLTCTKTLSLNHWRLLKSVNAKLLNSVFMLVTRFSGLQTLSHFSNDYIGVGALKLGSPIFHECRTIHFQPDC